MRTKKYIYFQIPNSLLCIVGTFRQSTCNQKVGSVGCFLTKCCLVGVRVFKCQADDVLASLDDHLKTMENPVPKLN